MAMSREQELQGIIDGLVIRNAQLQDDMRPKDELIVALREERDIWIFNAKALQKGYNELDVKLREQVLPEQVTEASLEYLRIRKENTQLRSEVARLEATLAEWRRR